MAFSDSGFPLLAMIDGGGHGSAQACALQLALAEIRFARGVGQRVVDVIIKIAKVRDRDVCRHLDRARDRLVVFGHRGRYVADVRFEEGCGRS